MKVLTDNKYYGQIANVIREQNGTNNTYKPQQMVSALKDLFYEEVEGVPPITFQGIGEDLLDYRIDGASGGVGEKTQNLFNPSILVAGYHLDSSGLLSPYTRRCATVQPISINCNSLILKFDTNVNDVKFIYSLFNNDTLVRREAAKISGETIDTTGANKIYISFYNSTSSSAVLLPSDLTNVMLSENDIDYEPYGYKVPVVVSRKNLFNGELLQGYYTDSTMSTLASQNSNYKSIKIYLKKGKYTLSSNINLLIVRFITSQVYQSNPSGSKLTKTFTFEIENDGYISLAFRNENNQTWDNSTNLQIEIGDTATTYEEYTSPTITTIYLDTLIYENESISLSDTNTNIQTVRGTNILTVDTTVQPSKVYVKSRKESSHEAQIRQLYESVNAELTQYKAQYGELGGE